MGGGFSSSSVPSPGGGRRRYLDTEELNENGASSKSGPMSMGDMLIWQGIRCIVLSRKDVGKYRLA